jgi:hypothetical protein
MERSNKNEHHSDAAAKWHEEQTLPISASWMDPETGEWLVLRLCGSEAFLTDLEAIGFEPMSGICDVVPWDHAGGRSRVRSSTALSGDKRRTGSTHPDPGAERESA